MQNRNGFRAPPKTHKADPNLKKLEVALALHQQGNFIEAKKNYDEILQKDPHHFHACHLSGVLSFQIGRLDLALDFYKKALRRNSSFAPLYLNYGNTLQKLGRFDEALLSFDNAISIKADYVDALYNRGNVLQELKRFREALESYDKAISIKSDHVEALYNRGNVLQVLQCFDEALLSYDKVLSIQFDHAEALYNRGNVLHGFRFFNEAIQSYDRALKIKHDFAEALCNRGAALLELKRFSEGLHSVEKAISILPNYADALSNRGAALFELGRFDEALQSCDEAISVQPDHAKAFSNRGNALKELKRFDEALLSYEKAILIKPDFADAFNNRGNAYKDLLRFRDALKDYESAITYKPDFFEAQSNRLFAMSYIDDLSSATWLEEAKKFGTEVARSVQEKYSDWNLDKTSAKVRIGFVSGDFKSHSVGFFLENVISNLDKNRVELIAYANNSYEDQLTFRFKIAFCSFKSIAGLDDEEAARLIHSDGVQILIDLSGHTALNRLPVFAYKPAPVQVSWLGYCGTTGLSEIDYILGDSYVTPPSEESHFSEKIKRLPENYICMTQPDVGVEVQDLPALKNGYITFGSFNNFSKVNESVIRLWAKILLTVERSCLFLKAGQLADPKVITDTVSIFQSLGISSERLSFEGHKNRFEHFDAYNKVDIGLDTFPYNGVTTTAEALWMGVPVIAKKGSRFVAHNGETICHNTGLSDWIAQDENEYYEKAVRFSSDLRYLASLRAGLRNQVLASPLFNAERFAGNFEKAMFELWDDYIIGR